MIKVFTDGGSRGNPGKAAGAFVVIKDDQEIYKEGKFLGVATNNVAEYMALLEAVDWLIKNNLTQGINFYLDSELVVKQLKKLYKIKSPNILSLYKSVSEKLNDNFFNYAVYHVPRRQNTFADQLVNDVLDEN